MRNAHRLNRPAGREANPTDGGFADGATPIRSLSQRSARFRHALIREVPEAMKPKHLEIKLGAAPTVTANDGGLANEAA